MRSDKGFTQAVGAGIDDIIDAALSMASAGFEVAVPSDCDARALARAHSRPTTAGAQVEAADPASAVDAYREALALLVRTIYA